MNRRHDSRICGAPAEDVRHGLLNLAVACAWIPVEECLGSHDDAVDAEAALHCLFVDEGLLDWMRLVDRAETLESVDFGLRRDGFDGCDTRTYGLTIDDYSAGAALPQAASEFWPAQGKIVAEDVEQWCAWIGSNLMALTVHPKIEGSHARNVTERRRDRKEKTNSCRW